MQNPRMLLYSGFTFMPKLPENKEQDSVKQYIHDEAKRANNPPVGLVTAETDHLNGKKTYRFDPHIDPQL
jgi:adenine-specific DNA-methyltransferase